MISNVFFNLIIVNFVTLILESLYLVDCSCWCSKMLKHVKLDICFVFNFGNENTLYVPFDAVFFCHQKTQIVVVSEIGSV